MIAWVCVAAVLAGVYLLFGGGSRGGGGEHGEALTRIPIDPAQVERLEVMDPDGSSVSAERASWSPTGWVLRWTENGRELAWAAREQRVRGALRAVSSARLGARTGEDDSETAATWVFESLGSGGVVVELLEGGVGGRRGVRVVGASGEPQAAWAGREVASALTMASMMTWRDGAALPRVGSGASLLTIEGSGARVVMSRARGRWFVREPVEVRGNEGVIGQTLAQLETLEGGDGGGLWVGSEDDRVTGLDTPVAVIEIESVRRIPEGDAFVREVTRQRLEVGGAAQASGETRFVRARSDVIREGEALAERSLGPVVLVVDVSVLSRLTSRVDAYVSRVPASATAADVGVVRLLDDEGAALGVYRRDRRGWVKEGSEQSVSGATERGIEGLLSIACERETDRIEVLGAESAIEGRLCEVRLESLGGTVLGVFELGAGDDGASLALRDGAVFWISRDPSAAGVLAWLGGIVAERDGD